MKEIAPLKLRNAHFMKPLKYEMTKRKETWQTISRQFEKQYLIPIEQQPLIVEELVSPACYTRLVSLLDIPIAEDSQLSATGSIDTVIPAFISAENGLPSSVPRGGKTLSPTSKLSVLSGASRSTISSKYSAGSAYSSQTSKRTVTEPSAKKSKTVESSEEFEALSNFVEVDRRIPTDIAMMMKHKAILWFLALPGGEVASWRTKEAKGVEELSEMTLEQQGDFLINKIAADFCEWIRKLGGDEKSFINEEILKELFQICMDNPASRAICIKTREKRVLYYKLAEFLQVPKKSFHEVLSSHLNWDTKVEKIPSRVKAFNKALPKDLRFKTPTNKTSETWLEWNSFSADQLSFADVYSSIKDLRSTREYCRWLLNHPEHKRPQYLVDEGFFESGKLVSDNDSRRNSTLLMNVSSNLPRPNLKDPSGLKAAAKEMSRPRVDNSFNLDML